MIQPYGRAEDRAATDRDEHARQQANDELERLVGQTLMDAKGRLRPHLDLDLGDVDEPSREAILYGVLAVDPHEVLLLGVSRVDTADLEACRSEWGEPDYRVDLHRAPDSPLAWDIWRLTAAAMVAEDTAGASLVLPEANPSWILYIDPVEDEPMLFICAEPCPRHL